MNWIICLGAAFIAGGLNTALWLQMEMRVADLQDDIDWQVMWHERVMDEDDGNTPTAAPDGHAAGPLGGSPDAAELDDLGTSTEEHE